MSEEIEIGRMACNSYSTTIEEDTFFGECNITLAALSRCLGDGSADNPDSLTFLDRSFVYSGASRYIDSTRLCVLGTPSIARKIEFHDGSNVQGAAIRLQPGCS